MDKVRATTLPLSQSFTEFPFTLKRCIHLNSVCGKGDREPHSTWGWALFACFVCSDCLSRPIFIMGVSEAHLLLIKGEWVNEALINLSVVCRSSFPSFDLGGAGWWGSEEWVSRTEWAVNPSCVWLAVNNSSSITRSHSFLLPCLTPFTTHSELAHGPHTLKGLFGWRGQVREVGALRTFFPVRQAGGALTELSGSLREPVSGACQEGMSMTEWLQPAL